MGWTTLTSAALGLVVGLALGTLGGGGSILVVPGLVYLLNVPPVEATSLSHVVVGATSLATVLLHWRAGRFSWPTALALAFWGVPGAFLGRLAGHAAPDGLILIALGTLMLATSLTMLHREGKPGERANRDTTIRFGGHPGRRLAITALAGLGLGFLTGFLGVGGGFLIVPVLVVVLGIPMKRAVGTSLGVIALNCASSLVFEDLTAIRWALAWPLLVTAGVAGAIGSQMVRAFDSSRLRHGFAWLVVALGALILTEALLAPGRPSDEERPTPPTVETRIDSGTPLGSQGG